MHLVLGLLATVMGVTYVVMALKDGAASDRSGLIIARRDTRPVAYWSCVVLFALMAVGGIGLILISTDL